MRTRRLVVPPLLPLAVALITGCGPDDAPLGEVGQAARHVQRLEAEWMWTKNYRSRKSKQASDGAFVRTKGTGEATTTGYLGQVRRFKARVRYLDENEGKSQGTLKVRGRVVAGWSFDRKPGPPAWRTWTSPSFRLSAGDDMTIVGQAARGGSAAIDYLELVSDGPARKRFVARQPFDTVLEFWRGAGSRCAHGRAAYSWSWRTHKCYYTPKSVSNSRPVSGGEIAELYAVREHYGEFRIPCTSPEGGTTRCKTSEIIKTRKTTEISFRDRALGVDWGILRCEAFTLGRHPTRARWRKVTLSCSSSWAQNREPAPYYDQPQYTYHATGEIPVRDPPEVLRFELSGELTRSTLRKWPCPGDCVTR